MDVLRGVSPGASWFSNGNTLPLLARPRGMAHWTAAQDSNLLNSWFANPDVKLLAGVRCTHQPSPWVSDYGQFLIGVSVEGLDSQLYADLRNPRFTQYGPHLLNVSVLSLCEREGCTRIEFAPSTRGGIFEAHFPPGLRGRQRQVHLAIPKDGGLVQASEGKLWGYSNANSGGVVSKHAFRHHFAASVRFPGAPRARKQLKASVWCGLDGSCRGVVSWIADDALEWDVVQLRLGVSFISPEQAALNRDRELAAHDSVRSLAAEAAAEWNSMLGRVEVFDSVEEEEEAEEEAREEQSQQSQQQQQQQQQRREQQRRRRGQPRPAATARDEWQINAAPCSMGGAARSVKCSRCARGANWTPEQARRARADLYTHLYRGLLFPRDLAEVDAANRTVHFSPYLADGGVREGPVMTDSGFWDAYRTVYPMLHLVYPDVARTVVEGWVNAMRENGGRVPEWPSPGPRQIMVGTMSDVSLAEAIVNGQMSSEAAAREALASLLRNARNASGPDSRGDELPHYIQHGYFPRKVAETLNSKLADWAIAQAARALGDEAAAQELEARAERWPVLFDQEQLFFRGKAPGGPPAFLEPFDPYAWMTENDHYTEGGPFQYRFYVPFAPARLAAAYQAASGAAQRGLAGGPEPVMCKALLETMRASPAYHMAGVIHEATEMAANCWGQYSHNNQPSHHMLYMFAHANCSARGQRWIQHAVQTLYGPQGYSGDEDNGEMASWATLSSLGLYALAPASGAYQVGAPPRFPRTVIHRPGGGAALEITRDPDLPLVALDETVPDVAYPVARAVRWNGQELDLSKAQSIPFKQLLQGGKLEFLP